MSVTVADRYLACLLLGAVGDSLAFHNGEWEFQRDGQVIHNEVARLGGVKELTQKDLLVSDDTVMHLATARGLLAAPDCERPVADEMERVCQAIAKEYVTCMDDMNGRAPGITCIRGARMLRLNEPGGWHIPFDRAGGGCGGAMRSMCIGLRYPKVEQEPMLIAVAIESGRMTHNHPTGYLGSLASALLTAYAIRGYPPKSWGTRFVLALGAARKYVEDTKWDVPEAAEHWGFFQSAWEKYLGYRNILDGESEPHFPPVYGVVERDNFYKLISWDGWGGSSGHDAPLIAYDALLGAKDNWEELCNRGLFHGGDSDSTGIIAGSWFGALYGFHNVYAKNYEEVEKGSELLKCAQDLYRLAYPTPRI